MDKPFTFAQRLKTLIEIKGLSNSDIAKTCQIDKSNVTRYLKGEYEGKQDIVYKIARKYDINDAWLMGYDVPMTASNVSLQFFASADPAQQERDKRMLAAFRLLPAEYQEFLIAQTEGAQQNRKDQDSL